MEKRMGFCIPRSQSGAGKCGMTTKKEGEEMGEIKKVLQNGHAFLNMRRENRDNGRKVGIWVMMFLFIVGLTVMLTRVSAMGQETEGVMLSTFPSGCNWPVDSPNDPTSNDYSAYSQTTTPNYKYHTGMDLTPSTPSYYATPVKSVAAGTVEKIFRTSDPTQTTTCQGSSISAPTNSHGLGNTVIIKHSNGKFTLYGHLDCINNGIVPTAPVSQGQTLGIMGNSSTLERRDGSFGPHVHFEYKDYGVVGSISDDFDGTNPTYWGYTPDPPDGYHFYDPRYISCPSFSSSTITKTPIESTTDGLNVRTGPSSPDYATITQINLGQKFVAFETSNFSGTTWYKIYLPNAGGYATGWVSGDYVVQRPNETQIEVRNAGNTGLIRDSANGNILQRWDSTPGYQVCRNVKIWDDQRFVSLGSQSGWYNYDIPENCW